MAAVRTGSSERIIEDLRKDLERPEEEDQPARETHGRDESSLRKGTRGKEPGSGRGGGAAKQNKLSSMS